MLIEKLHVCNCFYEAFACKRVKVRDFRALISHIASAVFNSSLSSRGLPSREIAFISGAGIAGLAASFELLARGFRVVIAEKRASFSRFNVINLNVETEAFLKRFNLLEDFKASVASKIKKHKYVVVGKKEARLLARSDVSQLQLDKTLSFEPENFNQLFNKDGIYSVQIGALQTFLAQKALEAGAHLFGEAEITALSRTETGGIAEVEFGGSLNRMILKPDLFFIAEGAHSETADKLGMATHVVENECTGENWIFGNVGYSDKKTFVVSLVDASRKKLQIANVIFNAKSQVINIAVTSERFLSEDRIREQILRTVQRAFQFEKIDSTPPFLIAVKKPVHVANRVATHFSIDNVFRIGDAAGHSSPLAGLGGTLGLTLIPRTIKQLLEDREKQPQKMHLNFKLFSEAYTSRWNEKSLGVKKFCLDLFDKESK